MQEHKISIQTIVTDWNWREDCRPELRLDDDHKTSALYVGDKFLVDIDGDETDELVVLLEGYRDIFARGVEFLNQKALECGK